MANVPAEVKARMWRLTLQAVGYPFYDLADARPMEGARPWKVEGRRIVLNTRMLRFSGRSTRELVDSLHPLALGASIEALGIKLPEGEVEAVIHAFREAASIFDLEMAIRALEHLLGDALLTPADVVSMEKNWRANRQWLEAELDMMRKG